MTIWSLDEIVQLLKNTYNALPKGGQVIIFNMMGNDEDTGPLSTALGSPYFLSIATGKGMLYSWSDYINAMEKSGFTLSKQINNLPLDHGIICGVKK